MVRPFSSMHGGPNLLKMQVLSAPALYVRIILYIIIILIIIIIIIIIIFIIFITEGVPILYAELIPMGPRGSPQPLRGNRCPKLIELHLKVLYISIQICKISIIGFDLI